ncbi:MAG: hypothetical protein JW780_00710 [Clostridiales bacterium]|nr:hypothetical protein [Clostridiales bacterium]
MKKRTAGLFDSNKRIIRMFAVFATTLCVLAGSVCVSSCSLNFELQPIEDALQENMDGVGFGRLKLPEGEELHEIGSAEDLFFVMQDSLYSFSPEVYIQVEEYPMFSRYWEELTVEGALHSTFQVGQMQTEYENRSPCTIRLIFSYNHSGTVLGEYISSDDPVFSDPEQAVLFELIENILAKQISEDMSDYEKVVVIHDYLVANSIYTETDTSDPSETDESEYLATALSVLRDGKGQCQGYSEAFAAIMIMSGVETRIISGKAFDSEMRFMPHAWNQVKLDGVWYHVDVTWDDPLPDTGGDVLHTYLFRSDEFFKKDHLWSEYFPECPSDNPSLG